jgi:hypothetical protein
MLLAATAVNAAAALLSYFAELTDVYHTTKKRPFRCIQQCCILLNAR